MNSAIRYLLLFVVAFACVSFVTAQTDSAKRAERIKEIKEAIKDMDKDEIQHIGTIAFNPVNSYPVYECIPTYIKRSRLQSNPVQCNIIKKIKIDSIAMTITNGFIINISVYSGKENYTNNQAPIALTYRRMGGEDNLYLTGNNNASIVYQEIINLSLDNSYIPEDCKIVLKIGNSSQNLQSTISINTILDARIYSDALGLVGGQSNGLAQTELKYKQIWHRINILNHGDFLGQYFKVNLNLSKFDSKDKYTDSVGFSRSKLLQRSYVTSEFAFNAINGWLFERKAASIYYLDGGIGMNLSRLSKQNDTINGELIPHYWFVEVGVNFRATDNAGADISGRYIKQYLPKNDFTSESGPVEFYKISGELYYNPIGKRASRVFAKACYTFIGNTIDRKNAFFQLQVGYSVLLTKLIN